MYLYICENASFIWGPMDAAALGRTPYREATPPDLTPSMSRNTSISRQKTANWATPHQRLWLVARTRLCGLAEIRRRSRTPGGHGGRPDGTPQQPGPARRGTYARRRAPSGYAGGRAPSSPRSCGACPASAAPESPQPATPVAAPAQPQAPAQTGADKTFCPALRGHTAAVTTTGLFVWRPPALGAGVLHTKRPSQLSTVRV